MPRKPKEPAPVAAEKPAYTIVKQTKSRWWEVRDRTMSWCASPCTGRAHERLCDGSPPEADPG